MKGGFLTRPIHCRAALLPWLLVAIPPMPRALEPHRFDVAVQVSRAEVEIAEPLDLTIRATAPPGWQIFPPVLPAEWQGVRVIGSKDTTEQTTKSIVWTRHVTLEAYDAGRKTIPPFEVTFALPHGDGLAKTKKPDVRKVPSAATSIHVRNALGLFESGSELRPIYDTVAVPWTWRQYAMAVGSAALILGSGLLVIRWVNRFHDADGGLSPQSRLRELAQLKEAWLRGSESDKETVLAACEIARRWLQGRQGSGRIHRTTDAWAAFVRRWNVAALAPVVDVLSLADRVKFAQTEPTIDEVRETLEQLRQVMHVDWERFG